MVGVALGCQSNWMSGFPCCKVKYNRLEIVYIVLIYK